MVHVLWRDHYSKCPFQTIARNTKKSLKTLTENLLKNLFLNLWKFLKSLGWYRQIPILPQMALKWGAFTITTFNYSSLRGYMSHFRPCNQWKVAMMRWKNQLPDASEQSISEWLVIKLLSFDWSEMSGHWEIDCSDVFGHSEIGCSDASGHWVFFAHHCHLPLTAWPIWVRTHREVVRSGIANGHLTQSDTNRHRKDCWEGYQNLNRPDG